MKESKTGDKNTQEIVIPVFDIHHKIFGSGNGEDMINWNFTDLCSNTQENLM